jgi:hypothetical protein
VTTTHVGRREGAGRKLVSQDRAPIEKTIRVQQGIAAALEAGLMPLDVIMSVMRGEPLSNGMVPTERQFGAAIAAAPFLHAKLSAVVMKDVSDAAPPPPPMLSVADTSRWRGSQRQRSRLRWWTTHDLTHWRNSRDTVSELQSEREAKQITARTKAALAQSKKRLGGYRGKPGRSPDSRLGSAAVGCQGRHVTARVRPTIEALRTEGKSLHQIAAELTARGVMTARGGQWDATRVRNVLARTGSAFH